MKMNMTVPHITKMFIIFAVAGLTGMAATVSHAQGTGAPRAVVEGIQGSATVTIGTDEEPQRLGVGSNVNAWNMVNTNGSSKLFLRWGTGVINSLGEFSSMFVSSIETQSGPVDSIQVTEGVLRVTKQSGGGPTTPYVVSTPTASVEPANYAEPIDFMVEVYSPQTTVVTVISGRVRVRNTTLRQPVEAQVDPCQSVYVDEGKSDLDVVMSTPEDLNRLVVNTTIPDTIPVIFQCPTPPGSPSVARPPVAVPQYVRYEYEDWDSYDIYPYNEIVINPPEPGIGCVVILPGIGRWIIPMDVFVGWRFDPAIIGVYCRHVIMDHMMYRDQYYLADVRLRQRQLRNMIYLAQLSGNRSMLLDGQRQLTALNVQSRWAAMRLNRLEQKLSSLNQEQSKFANKLPQGKNLFQAVSNSFNSQKNLAVAQTFKDRIKTELNVQGQLAGIAGKELVDLRSKIAREKNPQARLALTDEFHKISKDVSQGKLPIPANQPQVKQVLEKFKQEQDPKKLQVIQKELAQLTKVEAPRTSELLNQKNLATLKQDIAKFPNPQARSNLEAQVGQLQQSVEAAKTAELNREKIDTIAAQAAQESSPQKRSELLGQIKELAKPAAGAAGAVGALNLLQNRQVLESQLSLEQDKQKRAALEKALEEQRRHQAESLKQQLQPKQVEMLPQQEQLRKKVEPKHLEDERLKQTDQVRQQQLEQQKLLQQQELQKQQAEQKRKQEEVLKQTEQKRNLEQLEKQKQLQLDQQKVLKQQEEQQRHQIEAERLKKLEQQNLKEQAEQAKRKQLEAEQLRKQQEQSLQLRKQQEQEQLRKQQEQSLQLKKQQEQTEQMRRQQQQEQQKALQQQQQQKMLQQQQLQQQQLQQQQLQQQQQRIIQQQQQQQQQQLQQQQQMRQQQMRQQQDEDMKRRMQPPSPPGQQFPPVR